MRDTVSRDSIVVVSRDQVSADLAGEAAILQLESGIYYGLNTIGARIWQLIQTPTRVGEVAAALIEEYDVDADQCSRDVASLVESLVSAGLVDVTAT